MYDHNQFTYLVPTNTLSNLSLQDVSFAGTPFIQISSEAKSMRGNCNDITDQANSTSHIKVTHFAKFIVVEPGI